MKKLCLGLSFLILFVSMSVFAQDKTHDKSKRFKMVKSVKLTPAQVKAIKDKPAFMKGLTITSDNKIVAQKGFIIHDLKNGIHIFADSTKPGLTIQKAQVWEKAFADGSFVRILCFCPGADANTDDGCKFKNGDPNRCSGPECCKSETWYVNPEGGRTHVY